MPTKTTGENNGPERGRTMVNSPTTSHVISGSISIHYETDPGFKPSRHHPIPIPRGAPPDPQERDVITRLMYRDRLQSRVHLTQIISRLPRGLELSPMGMLSLRSWIQSRQEAFSRAKQDLRLADYVQAPVFPVLAHERRKILHFNITEAPSAFWAAHWAAQQVVEAFRLPPYRVISSGIGMASMARISCAESRAWAWNKNASRRAHLGRIRRSNA
jgi:hypothetical protein